MYSALTYLFTYCCCCLVVVTDSFGTPSTVACQAPLSMRFLRQDYWNGLTAPSPGDLPDLRIDLACLTLVADSLPLSLQGSTLFIATFNKNLVLAGVVLYSSRDTDNFIIIIIII